MPNPASPSRLLVVDGDEATRALMRRRFTRLGHETMDAADGERALSLIAMIPFDLVLLDLRTAAEEEGGGLSLLRRMRETRNAAELPILAIVDEAAGMEAAEALAAGADDCLARPLDLDLAHRRAEMLLRRQRSANDPQAAQRELQVRLEALADAAARAEAAAAIHGDLGHEVRAPLNGLLGAANVLSKICQTELLKRPIERIEAESGRIDQLMVEALGRSDRRVRTPKTKVKVLLADDDAGSRLAMRELLHATEIEVELVEVGAGLQAALATESMFFDLILVSLAAPEAIAGIRAIRRAERQNKTRRTPVLAFGPGGRAAAQTASQTASQTAAQTLDAGADLHMDQPVTAERVLGALAEAIAREAEDLSAVA